jgi:hypothetical protein
MRHMTPVVVVLNRTSKSHVPYCQLGQLTSAYSQLYQRHLPQDSGLGNKPCIVTNPTVMASDGMIHSSVIARPNFSTRQSKRHINSTYRALVCLSEACLRPMTHSMNRKVGLCRTAFTQCLVTEPALAGCQPPG